MESSGNKLLFGDWRRWKVPQLKKYLQDRGWRYTGNKEELVALCFAAEQMDVPRKPSALEKKQTKETDYQQVLTVNGVKMPDPFELDRGWENDVPDKWPPTMLIDITEYLLKPGLVTLGRRLLGDYKEGKAYSYTACGFIEKPKYHPIDSMSAYCFLKSKSLPSQCHSADAHKLWVMVEKRSGSVVSAYCTCFAGLGSTCNHVAGLLFMVDEAWKTGLTARAPTSRDCEWKGKNPKASLLPKQVKDYAWKKPHYRKEGQSKPINPMSRQLFRPTEARHISKREEKPSLRGLVQSLFPSSKSSAAFQYAGTSFEAEQNYDPADDVNLLEQSVEEQEVYTSSQNPVCLMKHFEDTDDLQPPEYSDSDINTIEKLTRGQAKNEEWKKYRLGMITATQIHSVWTKMTTLNNPESRRSKNVDSLLANMCTLQDAKLNDLPALKYGREMEPTARKEYVKQRKSQHRNLNVLESGLAISKEHSFLGGSPDGIIMCDCCGKGLLEIKCPLPQKESIPVLPKFLHIGADGDVTLRRSHSYYSQVQTNMALLGLQWCDFWTYNRNQAPFLERITFDKDHWHALKTSAISFFHSYMVPHIRGLVKSCDSHAIVTQDLPSTLAASTSTAAISSTAVMPVESEACAIQDSQTFTESIDVSSVELPRASTRRGRKRKRMARGINFPLYVCDACGEPCLYQEDITKDEQNSVQCEQCEKWIHWGCGEYKPEISEVFLCKMCKE